MKLGWLFLLAICPLMWADSVDYQAAGNTTAGTAIVMGSIGAGKTWSVATRLLLIDDITTGREQSGNLGMLGVTTGVLSRCGSGLCFQGGSLDIDNPAGQDLVDLTLAKGMITMSNGVTILTATFRTGGTSVIKEKGGNYSSQALVHGGVVPEPATCILLGTGLVGLALKFRKGGVKWQ